MSYKPGTLVIIRANAAYHMHHRIKPDIEQLSGKTGIYIVGPAGRSPFHKVIVGEKVRYIDTKRFKVSSYEF